MENKKQKKKIRLGSLFFLALCLVILGTFSFLIARQAGIYNQRRVELERFQEELARANAVYNDLHYQMAHFDSDAYIERLARERLGWVKPNEIVFRKITD